MPPHQQRRARSRFRGRWRAALAACGLAAATAGAAAPAASAWSWENVNLFPDELTITPAGAGAVVHKDERYSSHDPTAVLWREGSARATVSLDEPADHLWVYARADRCEGLPRMVVEVDGEVRLDTPVAATWGENPLGVAGPFAAGDHEVVVRFVDDHRTSACDRNLKLDRLAFLSQSNQRLAIAGTDFAVPTGTGAVFRHGPWGEPAVVLWTDTTATTPFVRTTPTSSLTVVAHGEACFAEPRMQVAVDGDVVLLTTVSTARHESGVPYLGRYTVPLALDPGLHELVISFVNDHRTADCDRNLDVREVLVS